MSDLPQELIDCIMDELSESSEDLRSLSLVGRAWLPRARYHLFRSITLAPRDPKEIDEYQAYLKKKALSRISPGTQRYYDPLTPAERKFLDYPLDRKPQNVLLSLLSNTDTLFHVRGLRLDSAIRIGGGRKVSPADYLQRWLGFGMPDPIETCIIARDLNQDDDFDEVQQMRWHSVDLPWGYYEGLHALPFCNLRSLHVQWSVFSWVCPFDLNDGAVFPPPSQWPGYQFGMLLKASRDTLEHVSIDEYPGFRYELYAEEDLAETSDVLLDVLARNAPNLRSLCLGGLMLPRPSLLPNSEQYTTRPPPSYPSGEEVPPILSGQGYDDIFLSVCSSDSLEPHNIPYLEKFFLRGFSSESTVLIDDSLLNRSRLVGSGVKYLAFSAMPLDYDYKILFSVGHSLTHLTLDVDESTHTISSRFHLSIFPKLRCLQLMIDPGVRDLGLTDQRYDIIESLYRRNSALVGNSQPPFKLHRLHIGFTHSIRSNSTAMILSPSSLDPIWKTVYKQVDRRIKLAAAKVGVVTINLPETVLQECFPRTFPKGCLKFQETEDWWAKTGF